MSLLISKHGGRSLNTQVDKLIQAAEGNKSASVLSYASGHDGRDRGCAWTHLV